LLKIKDRAIAESKVAGLWPERLDPRSAWIGHLPFAFWIVDALRPRVIVELGTHTGVSYCAFCQAVEHLALPCRAYAVDTWEGDAHTGPYSQQIFLELAGYHEPRYGAFSNLVRSTFDAAAEQFEPGTIDLLHIDGLHTYEAVQHDFENWRPLLSDRAVVLFHDTNVMHADFGVQKLWRELSREYPHFEFLHEHGLGVLAVGQRPARAVTELTGLTDLAATRVRETFARRAQPLKQHVALLARAEALQAERDGLARDLQAITQLWAWPASHMMMKRLELSLIDFMPSSTTGSALIFFSRTPSQFALWA
jgi:hypothetical protein